MTTNVPQDVIDDFKEAGFPVELMFDWDTRLAKFLQLRAQRQQGAEPVASMVKYPDGVECLIEGFNPEAFDGLADVIPLYTTPPQSNTATEHPCDPLVAAAYRKAAEIVTKLETDWDLAYEEILSAIPKESTDAEAALREVCMRVAKKAVGYGWSIGMENSRPEEETIQAIVNSVLGEGKS